MSAKNPFVNYATAHTVPASISNTHQNQKPRNTWRLTPFRLCLFLLLVAFGLVACGPEEGASDGDLTAETVRIAQEYQQSGDLGNARAELESLDAANPTQFLIFLAEDRADTEPGTPETNALVQFALALGLQSGQLMAYATQNGLLPQAEVPTPQPVALPAAQPIEPATDSEQAQAAAEVPTATAVAAAPIESTEGESSSDQGEGTGTEAEGGADDAASEEQGAVELVPTATAQATTATAISKPQIQASNALNVRSGPGTAYPVVGALNSGEQADIVAKNPEGDWWQVTLPSGGTGWVYGPLVQAQGDTSAIAVASDIPPAPPTPTPAPVAEAPTAAAEQPTAAPEQPAEPTPAPVPAGNDFIGIERRLWTVEETGGVVDSGGSVRCGEKRELHVIVLDANGNRLNGVAVQAIYGAQETFVTGNQGKGEGQVEFVLGAGQGVKVIRDADGREVTSDVIDGMSTHSPEISHSDLIAARYCWDDASCDKFNYSAGCWGHHSWTVTFKRKY
jgi:uncharacterized protein YraI